MENNEIDHTILQQRERERERSNYIKNNTYVNNTIFFDINTIVINGNKKYLCCIKEME